MSDMIEHHVGIEAVERVFDDLPEEYQRLIVESGNRYAEELKSTQKKHSRRFYVLAALFAMSATVVSVTEWIGFASIPVFCLYLMGKEDGILLQLERSKTIWTLISVPHKNPLSSEKTERPSQS